MDLDTNPMDEERAFPTGTRPRIDIPRRVVDLAAKQKPYFDLIAQFQALFYEIPDLTARDVDARVKAMYETLMDACERVGISRMSIPALKECCGKKRVWKNWFRLGDTISWITTKLHIKKCDGCKERQEALNKVRWPFS